MSTLNKLTILGSSQGKLSTSTDTSSPKQITETDDKLKDKLSIKLFIRNLKEVKTKEILVNEAYIQDIKLNLHGEK